MNHLYCSRCGAAPGESSRCTGGYTHHDFLNAPFQPAPPAISPAASADAKSSGDNLVSILFLAADPTDACRLRLGQEFREIREKLALSPLRDRFRLELPQLSVRPADLSQALLNLEPQIVHFSGHGTPDGGLWVEDYTGKTQVIEPEALAALFREFAHQVKCVVLNACYSEAQAEATAQHIEYVVGMCAAISDEAAIAYAVGFYQAIGAGRTIPDAHALGCAQVRLMGIPEHATPVLVRREASRSLPA